MVTNRDVACLSLFASSVVGFEPMQSVRFRLAKQIIKSQKSMGIKSICLLAHLHVCLEEGNSRGTAKGPKGHSRAVAGGKGRTKPYVEAIERK